METRISKVVEGNMLSLQIVPTNALKMDNGRWRRSSVFSTSVTCRGQECLLYIDSGSTVNEVLYQLVEQLGLPTESVEKTYQVAWVNRSSMAIS